MVKRLLVAVLVTALACAQAQPTVWARDVNTGYLGVEFFGASAISKLEIEKTLGLKPGASITSASKAIESLQKRLAQRRIKANIDLARQGTSFYITVDVLEAGNQDIPLRKLQFPHHVLITNEQAFVTFDKILARRDFLAQQSKDVVETYEDGIKKFSDEPCNQFASVLEKQIPPIRKELMTLIANDPDPVRRSKAIEVLNWDPNATLNCQQLIPAINDGSELVRASTARYIFPRIKMLPENFPFPELIENFSYQLIRPSHMDRLLGLRCLTQIGTTQPQTMFAIKEYDAEKLKQLQETSIVPVIKESAEQLLSKINSMPIETKKKRPVQLNEF